jgi:hypothetical protein
MSQTSVRSPLVRPDAGWVLSLYPKAGEAGGTFVPSVRPVRTYVPGTPAADPERARSEAHRRARAKVRRYCSEHRLNRLGTLTYAGAGCHDPLRLRRDVGEFFRSLRSTLGGKAFPYLWVPEWHASGHGLHVHFAVGGFVPRAIIDAAWGRGFVHIKRLSNLPVGSGSRGEARLAAGYLSKYVSKAFDADESSRSLGLHRYEVAEGFQPEVVSLRGCSAASVLAQAVGQMGAKPTVFWSSLEVEGWQGPPAVWVAWD